MKRNVTFSIMLGLLFIASIHVHAADVNYITQWGRLKLVGNQLSNQSGNPIQLKGWSTFGFYAENCLKTEADLQQMKGYGANCVRIARNISSGTIDDDGIKNWMKLTADNGMYCIIDWNLSKEYNDYGNPSNCLSQASSFFQMVAQEVKDKGYKHIIYELFSEPSECKWTTIKSCATTLINAITRIDTNKPVIIVGTPVKNQAINSSVVQTGQLITTDKAWIMYSFHFWANERIYQQMLHSEFLPATNKIPVIVTTWGMSTYDSWKLASYEDVNERFSDLFLQYCNKQGGCGQVVSWINWSYGCQREGCSSFNSYHGNLSKSGNYVVNALKKNHILTYKGVPYGGNYNLTLSKTSNNATLNLGYYDDNKDRQEGDWASALGFTYYDADITEEEGYIDGEFHPLEETVMSTNIFTNNEREVLLAYEAKEYCDHRFNESVDVDGAQVEGDWNTGLYRLGWIQAGEWVNYTVDVKDPGYYSLQMAVNTYMPIGSGVTVDEEAGIITYKYGGFKLSLWGKENEIFMVDITNSTTTDPISMGEELFAPYIVSSVSGETPANDWEDCVWCYTGDEKTGKVWKNYGILFKRAGQHIIKFSFPYGYQGPISGLRFTYVKTYEGNDITTGISDALPQDNVQCSMFNVQCDAWYTIDGQKLNGMPTKKGVYIHNGKAVVN